MKSRISFFNFTLYKKTISRFAVLGGAYLGFWLLSLPLTFVNRVQFEDAPFDIVDTITIFGVAIQLQLSCNYCNFVATLLQLSCNS